MLAERVRGRAMPLFPTTFWAFGEVFDILARDRHKSPQEVRKHLKQDIDFTLDLGAFKIRSATELDLPGLHHLINSGYRGDSSRLGWTTEADFLGGQRIDQDRLRELVQDPLKLLLCFESKTEFDSASKAKLVGTVTLERIAAATEPSSDAGSKVNPVVGCYLGMLTVDPRTQSRGLGRQILEACEVLALRWGASFMKLTVIQLRLELMSWYERRGYVKTGETEDFPYGDIRYGEPTRSDLHFVVFKKSIG